MAKARQSGWLLTCFALAWSIAGCSASTNRHTPVPTSYPGTKVGAAQSSGAPADTISTQDPDTASEFETSHPDVQDFVVQYQTNLRGFLSSSLSRGSKYLNEITSILVEEGVPTELAYLPIVESGFRINAVSRAGAVGPWQFMGATGRRYGLRIDGYVDERRDPEKATRAAAQYLRDLHGMFGDWHLSLAAYNVGEGRIARIRDQEKIDDYWQMTEDGHLPRETSEFVPRVLAAMEIASAPETYGFEATENEHHRYDTVHVDRLVSLATLAKLSGTSPATLSELNPALRRGLVPPHGYDVRIPGGSAPRFRTALSRLPRYLTHKVRRGDTPSAIARRYHVPLRELMGTNNIRNARLLRVGQVLRIPAPVDVPTVRQVAARGRKGSAL